MSRQLSSSGTFISKYLFPVLMIVITPYAFLLPIISPGKVTFGKAREPLEAWSAKHLFSSLVIAVVTIFVLRYANKLKEVWLETDTLQVRNYFRTIAVPLELIERVTVGDGRYKSMTIHLRQESPFGKEIYFHPSGAGGFSSEWRKFPDEILKAAAAARRRNARTLRSNRKNSETSR
jgi:hypothetical protein